MAETDDASVGIGVDGLKALLEEAGNTLGRCRFIVANTASGGILEAVQDFAVSPFRYSEPSPRGHFATVGVSTFECHFNLDKIAQVVFAKKKRPGEGLEGDLAWMYIIRFLAADGSSAVSIILHKNGRRHGGQCFCVGITRCKVWRDCQSMISTTTLRPTAIKSSFTFRLTPVRDDGNIVMFWALP